MARSFTSSGQYLLNTNTSVSSSGSVFMWIKPNWNGVDGQTHVMWFYSVVADGTEDRPSFQKFTDNNIYIGWSFVGPGDQRIVLSSSGIFVSGKWSAHMFTWDSGSEYYYVDGVVRGSRVAALTTTTATRLRVANYDNNIVGNQRNCNSSLSDFARWDRALTPAEVRLVSFTGSPLAVPNGLQHYADFFGADSPEPDRSLYGNRYPLTPTGSAQVDDPPLVRQYRMRDMITQLSQQRSFGITETPPGDPAKFNAAWAQNSNKLIGCGFY